MDARKSSRTMPGLRALLREDLRTQREGLLSQGFWALAVYRIGHRRLSLRRGIRRKLLGVFSQLGRKWIEITTGISLPEGVQVGRRLAIEHFGGIMINNAAVIGDDCRIRHGLTLGNREDQYPHDAPTIGDRVQIGAQVSILGKVTVGDDAIIGAHSLVLHDVPPGAIVAGVPARVLRLRDDLPPQV